MSVPGVYSIQNIFFLVGYKPFVNRCITHIFGWIIRSSRRDVTGMMGIGFGESSPAASFGISARYAYIDMWSILVCPIYIYIPFVLLLFTKENCFVATSQMGFSTVCCQPWLQRRMSKTADISGRPGQAPVKHHGSTAIRCEEILCPCPQKGNTKSILGVSSPCQQKGNYARAVKFEAVGKHPESAFDRK